MYYRIEKGHITLQSLHLSRVELGSIAWKTIILTIGLPTPWLQFKIEDLDRERQDETKEIGQKRYTMT